MTKYCLFKEQIKQFILEKYKKTKEEKLETKLEKENIDTDKKLEKIAKQVLNIEKSGEFKQTKEQNGLVTYTDNTFKTYNSGTEQFYELNTPKNYYTLTINENTEPVYSQQSEQHEQKKEQDAEKSQYLSKESIVFGTQITTNGSPSRDEQTTMAASSIRTEAMYMFKILHPGWWKCLYELKTTLAEYT